MWRDRNGQSNDAFRADLRAWLDAVYPPEWRDPLLRLRGADAEWWYRKQWDDGWRAPAWPQDHGRACLSVGAPLVY